jgi:hypothetical protein
MKRSRNHAKLTSFPSFLHLSHLDTHVVQNARILIPRTRTAFKRPSPKMLRARKRKRVTVPAAGLASAPPRRHARLPAAYPQLQGVRLSKRDPPRPRGQLKRKVRQRDLVEARGPPGGIQLQDPGGVQLHGTLERGGALERRRHLQRWFVRLLRKNNLISPT